MTFAAAFNGGKTQVNFGPIQFGGEFPFLNLIKASNDLTWFDLHNSPVTPDYLDAQGYPTAAATALHGGIRRLCFGPDPVIARPGNLVLKWTGTGTPSLGFSNTPQDGTSLTPIAGIGRYVFSTIDARYDIGIDHNVKNLVLCHVDDEARSTAGEVFGVEFKRVNALAKFGVHRFLNWQPGNGSNMTTWATRKPVDYITYGQDELRLSMYCQTIMTRSGTAYSVTGPAGFAIADKATFTAKIQDSYDGTNVTFTNTFDAILMPAHNLTAGARLMFNPIGNQEVSPSSIPTNFSFYQKVYVVAVPDADHIKVSLTLGGTPITAGSAQAGAIAANPFLTLNVSGTGTKDMLAANSGPLLKEFNNYPVGGTYQSLATFVYDATLDAYMKFGGGVDPGATGLINGCPPELMVQLCAEVGAHPYFTAPHLAIDPATDYMPSLAAYCRDNGPSWMIPRFEGPNELWNTASGFHQTNYAITKATAYGWGADYQNWYGKMISVLGQIVSAIYAGDRTRYRLVCGVQTSTGDTVAGTASSAPRVLSTKYIGTTPQSALVGPWGTITLSATVGVAEGWRWITTGCCAQYFTPSEYDTTAETTKAAAYAGAIFKASIVGDVLTVTELIDTPPIIAGMVIQGQGAAGNILPASLAILTFGTGGTGGIGTYKVNASLTTPVPSIYMLGGVDLTTPNSYAAAADSGSGPFTISACKALFSNWKTFFSGHGIQEMCGYEGGYSPDLSGGIVTKRLRSASKQAAILYNLTTKNYDNFTGLSDGVFVANFPSCFTLGNGIYGGQIGTIWSAADDLWQSPPSPQLRAIIDYNARKLRLKVRN